MGGQTAPQNRIAAKIERDVRRAEAIRLARDGSTYAEIADRLGYSSPQAAHRDVKAALAPAAKALREAGIEYLAIQAMRLEQAHADMRAVFEEYGGEYSDAADQRIAAVLATVRISESFRKLIGLDAPAKTETKTTLDATVGYAIAVSPEELEQL